MARPAWWSFIVVVWLVYGAETTTLPSAQPLPAQSGQQFRERVDVPRVLIDVRVVDAAGRALPNLTRRDFAVTIDRKPAAVDTVEWVSVDPTHTAPLTAIDRLNKPTSAPDAGRWFVFLYQKHTDLSDVEGFMRLRRDVENLTKLLRNGDHACVLSFDTSLHYWLDFTNDVPRIVRTMNHDLLVGAPPALDVGTFPSLASHLTPASAATAYSIEDALRLVGDALEPLPGPKTIILFGYGMGTWLQRFGAVQMAPGFVEAVASLQRARVSVFCVDVTKAEYHPREEGLRVLADDTGGFYLQSYGAPVFDRLAGAVAGYYVLLVVPPDAAKGSRTIEVALVGHSATVIAKRSYLAQ